MGDRREDRWQMLPAVRLIIVEGDQTVVAENSDQRVLASIVKLEVRVTHEPLGQVLLQLALISCVKDYNSLTQVSMCSLAASSNVSAVTVGMGPSDVNPLVDLEFYKSNHSLRFAFV